MNLCMIFGYLHQFETRKEPTFPSRFDCFHETRPQVNELISRFIAIFTILRPQRIELSLFLSILRYLRQKELNLLLFGYLVVQRFWS